MARTKRSIIEESNKIKETTQIERTHRGCEKGNCKRGNCKRKTIAEEEEQ
ncbi:37959_t:CDS:2, partial [Gigaspora margarita]